LSWTGSSTERAFDAPKDRVFQAALNAAAKVRMKVKEADPEAGRLLLRSGMSMTSWGENLVLHLTETDGRTTVSLDSKLLVSTNIFAKGKHQRNFDRLLGAIAEDLGVPT